jgi:hypothetical protein
MQIRLVITAPVKDNLINIGALIGLILGIRDIRRAIP